MQTIQRVLIQTQETICPLCAGKFREVERHTCDVIKTATPLAYLPGGCYYKHDAVYADKDGDLWIAKYDSDGELHEIVPTNRDAIILRLDTEIAYLKIVVIHWNEQREAVCQLS